MIYSQCNDTSEPFYLIPYVIKNRLLKNTNFYRVKDYWKHNDTAKNIYKSYKATLSPSKQPKYKFGIQIPNNTGYAYNLDKINNDKGWEMTTNKEIESINNHKKFITLEEHEPLPPGYQKIPYHMISDAKFNGRKKARLVTGGHRAPEVPQNGIYSGVVSIEMVRLVFFLEASNGLEVCATNVATSFLYGKPKKVYVIAGKECGENQGKRMIIEKGLYGLASSAARFHNNLAAT